MDEELYAKLLAGSAIETRLAQKRRQITVPNQAAKFKAASVFDQIGVGTSHDVMVLIEEFARMANTTSEEIVGSTRKAPIVNARHVMFYVMHEHLNMSNHQIGRICNRDASTVQTGRDSGQRIVEENKFLLKHIQEALEKAKVE